MAALLHQESRRLYSWWWDSHISPKNSKWLQENLTDMDAKVKAMIKLIEEDADSFARRAEMYYKKRPELMKLVEEFYRAYRALAERYNHATVELRHAHKTMSEAFPNQVPYSMSDDSSSQDSVEPHTPENSHPSRALLSPDELHALKRNKWYSEDSDSGISKRGLKQLREMFGSEGKMKKGENNEVENEVETLKKTLAEIEAEKEAILLQYQKTLQNFLERELSYAQKNANGLDDRASKADIEIKVLKEALVKLQGERDDGLLRYNNCLERIASLESMISRTHEDAKGLNERASKAEIEAQNLKQELSRLEAEKDDGLQQYKQCLEMISALENKIALAEENAKMLNETTERAESEVQSLKKALAKLREEKDAVAFRYEQCLEKMANMEKEMLQAQEDSKRLNDEIVMGNAKLKNVEQQCSLLESSNESLQAAAVDLSQKIAGKDKELFFKQKELEKLQSLLVDEHSQFVQAETTLQTLQKLHSQTQEEHKALTLELQSKLQTLKDLEICNLDLGEDLQKVKKENEKLHELNNLSTVSMKNLQSEIHGVREIKEKLEEEIARQAGKSNVLQQEVFILKEEITGLNRRYEALVKQVFAVGLNPEFLESSVKGLQDENTKLKEVCNNHKDERDALYEKLRNMDHILEKNTALEGLVLELNGKLGGSNQKVEDLKESCQFLREEKLSLVSEKATLLSQLQIMTENMQKLLEKNILLENSLAGANVELQGLRAKSKSLEEFCQMLKDEKSNLIHERGTLVAQLENIERRLGHLENRFTNLEEKYFDLEKEKESTLCQVEELRGTLNAEQQERVSYEHASESRLADLENNVNRLEEERRLTKKEFEEELDKAVNAQVEIFILQKFIEDLEDKNLSLLIECQKHVEASKLSDKVISELECENLEQQVEAELLLDEIAKLRTGIYKIFKALPLGPMVKWHEDEIEQGQSPIPRILNNIEDLKCSLSRNEEEKHKLVVENSVLLTLLQQLRLDGCEIQSEKRVLEEEFMIVREQHDMLKKDKNDLLEINKTMMLEMSDVGQQRDELKAKLEREGEKMVNLQGAYMESQEEKSKLLKENETLLKEFSGLKEQKCVLEEENSNIFKEAVDLSSLVSVLECVGMEKAEEAQELAKDLYGVRMVNNDLKKEVELLEEKLGTKEVEVLHLSETVEQLYEEVDRVNDLNVELDDQVLAREESLRQKTMELLEAEGMLKASHNLNAELCRNVDDLQQERKELKANKETLENRILEITEDCTRQEGEIEFLREENSNLECEVGKLSEEIEEQKIREVYLSSELQERSNEFELWESEASSFYFDLQISSVREVLLENKVQELTGACENLKDEGATKSLHIDEMKEKVGGLESEVGKLKVQLSSYVPVIASLRDHVASFEHNVLGEKNLRLAGTKNQVNPDSAQSNVVTDGISELHELQTRIREVERAVVEEIQRLTKRESIKPRRSNAEDMKSRSYPHDIKDDLGDNLKLQKSKPEISEVKNKTLMKDIPLDQVSGRSFSGRSKKETSRSSDRMLGLWEYIEQDGSPDPAISNAQNQLHRLKDLKFKNPSAELQVEKEVGVDKQEISRNKRETNKEESNRKILKRLASDAEKLASLKTTVEELKRKMGRSKGSKKANNPEYETVRSHLKEVEETVIQLVEINNRLTNGKSSAEVVDSENDLGEKVKEEVRKGSEKIGRLQIDVLSIQNVLMKLDDENKLKGGKDRLRSRTSVLLREFISGRNSGIRKKKVKKKKGLCGCVRPTTNTD